MQGIPQQLKAHLDKCHEKYDCVEKIRTPSLNSYTVSNFNDFGSPMTSENLNQICETPRPAKISRLMTNFVSVSRTATCEKKSWTKGRKILSRNHHSIFTRGPHFIQRIVLHASTLL